MQDTTDQQLPASPVKRVRGTREKVSQKEIDDLNQRHERIHRSVIEIVKEVIELGEKLAAIKTRLGHGRWEPWVEKNLKFTVRTARRYMTAAEQKEKLYLGQDPAEFMSVIWGHEPKQITGATGVKKGKSDAASDLDEDEDDDEDVTQHGGDGLKVLPEVPWTTNRFIENFDRCYFSDAKITIQEKLDTIKKIKVWLDKHQASYEKALLDSTQR